MDCLFVTILRIVQWLRSLASLVFLDFLRLIIRFVETLADCLTSAPDWISIWPQILRDFNWQEILFMIFVFCFEMPWRFVATLKDCSKSFWDYWEDFRIPWYVCVHFGRPKLTLAYLNSWVCSTAVEWSLIWFESHQFHRRIWCLRGNLEYSMGGGVSGYVINCFRRAASKSEFLPILQDNFRQLQRWNIAPTDRT